MTIDPWFDARDDAGGKDPDSHSATLKSYHQALWSRAPRPGATAFEFAPGGRDAYLRHVSDQLGNVAIGSDTIATSHQSKCAALYAQTDPQVNEAFHRQGMTLGGFLVFPVRYGLGMSVNQARGWRGVISYRLDLTLECIRRYYTGSGASPLQDRLEAYSYFFDLFGDFAGYVEFFFLDDLVDGDGIRWLHDFDDFRGRALPTTLESYLAYRDRQLAFVEARNARIEAALPGLGLA